MKAHPTKCNRCGKPASLYVETSPRRFEWLDGGCEYKRTISATPTLLVQLPRKTKRPQVEQLFP